MEHPLTTTAACDQLYAATLEITTGSSVAISGLHHQHFANCYATLKTALANYELLAKHHEDLKNEYGALEQKYEALLREQEGANKCAVPINKYLSEEYRSDLEALLREQESTNKCADATNKHLSEEFKSDLQRLPKYTVEERPLTRATSEVAPYVEPSSQIKNKTWQMYSESEG